MFESLKIKLEKGALAALVLAGLFFCVIGFLALAVFSSLLTVLPVPLAALVTAAAGIVSIAVIWVLTKLIPGKTPTRGEPVKRESVEETIETFLRQQADPALTQWAKGHPDKAALMTLLLGVAAGYSQAVRRALLDTYMRHAQTQESGE